VGGDFYCSGNDNLIYDEPHFYGYLPNTVCGVLRADDNKCDYDLAKHYYKSR
jgi:hypothetical protein